MLVFQVNDTPKREVNLEMQGSESKYDLNQASRKSRKPFRMIEAVQVEIVVTGTGLVFIFT